MACGFGFGIGVMAGLLGIGEVIVEQARSPALEGGGDVVVSGMSGEVKSARFVMTSVLGAPPLGTEIRAVSPGTDVRLYLVDGDDIVPVDAKGGIPSLERKLGDPETSSIEAWTDAPGDRRWSDPDPGDVLRAMDRFHPIPDVAARASSWAEWLYFNGTAGETRFYLSIIVGSEEPDRPGFRRARARLQLDRAGERSDYFDTDLISEAELLESAPDIRIGDTRVTLDGLQYRIDLSLVRETDSVGLTGRITLDAVPGRSLPPFTVRGARGWVSGYVVPVLSGTVNGKLEIGDDEVVDLDGGTGYHDHNWGFWEGVTWRWGQVAGDGLSFVYGRIRPPEDAADPERLPGFMMILGPDRLLGFSYNVQIKETEAPGKDHPETITVQAREPGLDVRMTIAVDDDATRSRLDGGTGELEFLQMRGTYRVEGQVGDREFDFSARGAAETFRGE
jgi:hypothetical protein